MNIFVATQVGQDHAHGFDNHFLMTVQITHNVLNESFCLIKTNEGQENVAQLLNKCTKNVQPLLLHSSTESKQIIC